MKTSRLNFFFAGLVSLVLVVSGCATTGNDIKATTVVEDSKANLKGYKTYSWLAGMTKLEDPQGEWKPLGFDADSELRFLVDKEMRDRGYIYADGQPDAYVAYLVLVNTDTEMQAEEIKKYFGEDADLSNTSAGALVIGLVDPQAEKMVWAGAATGQIKKAEERTPDLTKARLAVAVEKIFDQYPQ